MPSLLIITDAHRARHASHNHSHTMTVIFDFGGVLVDWNQRYYYRQYFNDDERMEYFLSHVLTNEWNLENDRGRPYSEGVRLLCAQYPEWREAIEAFPTHWPEMLHAAKPEGVALLRELKRMFPQALIVGHRDLNPMKACPCFEAAKEYLF